MPSIGKFLARLFSPAPTTPTAPVMPRGLTEWRVSGVRFADDGLTPHTTSETSLTWFGARGERIELTKSALEEAIHPDELERLRNEQRRVATANNRGLVSAEMSTTMQGLTLFEVITKARSGMGHDYVGTVTGTDESHTYTVRVAVDEAGTTGLREAAVSAQLWELGEIRLPAHGVPGRSQAILGWYADPYDPSWDDNALNSVTDDERLDVAFPAHPLSLVRAFIAQVRQSLVCEANVRESGPATVGACAAGMKREGPRRLLSDTAIREVQWKHECFDAIAASLQETLATLGPGEGRDERAADLLLLLGITQSRQENQAAESLMSLARARDTFREVLGGDHLKTAVATGHLARAHFELGKLKTAADLFLQAIEVLETELPNHMVLGMVLNGYGRVLLAEDNPEAIQYVLRARDMAESLGGGRRCFLLQETAGAPAPTVSTTLTIVQPR